MQQLQPSADDAAEVTEAVLTASRALVAVAARSLAVVDDDVTLAQYRALVVLAARGPQHPGELAQLLDVHGSTITRLCDRLVAKRLVHRRASRTNRREVQISLSPAGTRVVTEVTRVRKAEIGRIVERLDARTRSALLTGLREFAAAAGEQPDETWVLGWQ